jgi:MOSC domain-containing protein
LTAARVRLGTVAQLWRYPVKSLTGERMQSVALSSRGIPGDRGWAVYDETRNGITGAKRLPALRACGAHYPSEPVAGAAAPPAEITLPDGARLMTDAADAPRRLGELLGRPVSLRGLGPAGSEAAPRLTSAGESVETVRALAGVLPDEPMPDTSEFPPERLRLLRQGNHFDAFPIHLLTRTTLRTLARLAPESVWDERRFRPNLLVEVEDPEGYPELSWIGRRLGVGSAVIEIVAGCPRCVMVTQPVDDVPHDTRVLRTLVRETKHLAGIYARVVEEGVARVGEEIVPIGG